VIGSNLGRWGGAGRGRRDLSRSRTQFGVSGFNPLNVVTPVVAAWAEDPSWTPPADGGAVSSWRLSGSLGSFTLDTLTGTPVYRATGFGANSKPHIDFASNQSLFETFGSTVAQPYVMLVVGSKDTIGVLGSAVDGISVSQRAQIFVSAAGLFGGNAGGSQTLASPAVVANTAFVGAAEFNGASGVLSLDGGVLSTGKNMSTQGATGLTVGENYTAGQDWVGNIAFVGMYSGAVLTSGGLDGLIAGLKTYYGIA
jgi:hypothetical protein